MSIKKPSKLWYSQCEQPLPKLTFAQCSTIPRFTSLEFNVTNESIAGSDTHSVNGIYLSWPILPLHSAELNFPVRSCVSHCQEKYSAITVQIYHSSRRPIWLSSALHSRQALLIQFCIEDALVSRFLHVLVTREMKENVWGSYQIIILCSCII